MTDPQETVDTKTVVPASNAVRSLPFCRAPGFGVPRQPAALPYLHAGHWRFRQPQFLVQKDTRYSPMPMLLPDAEGWQPCVREPGPASRRGAPAAPPVPRPRRIGDFCVIDSGGVLGRIGPHIDASGDSAVPA